MSKLREIKTLFATKETIGQQIRELRENKGWTQAWLAEMTDVTDVYISLVERGKRTPSIEVQRAIQYWLHNDCVCPTCGRKI